METRTILRAATADDEQGSRSTIARRIGSLPPDMLHRARSRLQALSALFAAIILSDMLFAIDAVSEIPMAVAADSVPLLACTVVFFVARSRRVPDQWALDAGLVLQVLLCFIISLAMTGMSWRSFQVIPLVDWTTVFILLFPLIIPTPPLRAWITSAVSAAMPSLVVLLLAARGVLPLDPISMPGATVHPVLAVAGSPVVAAVIAGITSRWLYGLGRDVARARELGAYRLEEKLGQGGMGEVWRGRHRLLARPAAIKLVRPEVLGGSDGASTEVLHRFEREAQATASLCSPHTIDLFDFGVSDQGIFYYVMELLEGYDLETLVERFGPLPPARTVGLLRQVCASLGEAHDAGMIHRDVKPANVYVCRYGREVDFVKVLDFGLVKGSSSGGTDSFRTREFTLNGTPAFMAPEQATGTAPVDARADLYALGCVAYWMLTASLVFEAKTPMDLVVAHARSSPEAPSTRTETRVPASLDAIVLRCLAKDPAERPASADEVDLALAAVEDEIGRFDRDAAREWWRVHGPSTVATAQAGA